MLEGHQPVERMNGTLPSELLAGSIAGFAATAPMTVAMELMHDRLPWWQRYPLPPSRIVTKIAERVGLQEHMDEEEHSVVSLAAHFAYGSAAGAVYAPLAGLVPLPPALKGVVFGLIVWAASYLGLLPALGILGPATRHPPGRTALMIAAHIVWGLTLGIIVDSLQRRDEQ